MLGAPIVGIPGLRAEKSTSPRTVFRSGTTATFIAGGKIIDGAISRDPGNTGNLDTLRAGLIMGKVTSGGKYAPSIMGLTNAAYTSGTSLTVTAAAAVELARRVGATGTFTIAGPSVADGVVLTETVTYSLISGTTVTITALTNDYISGSFIMPNDGSEDPLTFIPDGTGIKVTDVDASNVSSVPFPEVPIAAEILTGNVVNYPSDAGLKAWLKGMLRQTGNWIFSDEW